MSRNPGTSRMHKNGPHRRLVQRSDSRSCSCSRAAVRSAPIRRMSIRRSTRPGSSPIGSSARRSAPSTLASSPATSPSIASTGWRNSGAGWSARNSGVWRTGRGSPTPRPIGRPCSGAFRDSSSPIRWLFSAHTIRSDGTAPPSTRPHHWRRRSPSWSTLRSSARCTPRLTVGAAHVRTSEMRYFYSRETAITVQHVMASGALPPAFPAVRIDGELYWDGGILSNTPTEAIFDDNPRRDSLIFAVHMWNPMGPEPESIWEVLHRHKDIQYSSRVASHIARQRQVHKLRHVVSELVKLMPEDVRARPVVKDLAEYGGLARMHVVRLLAPRLDSENHTKDSDFSPTGIRLRWEAGYADTTRALQRAPWNDARDPLEGVILHAPAPDVVRAAE